VKIDSKRAIKMLRNVVEYSEGFILETQAKESYVASKLASTSVASFYNYLDSLARTNPGMLHHVYEWGEVGNPQARLFELKKILKSNKVLITSDFKQSSSIPDGATEPFYDKARIMEDGITVVVNEVNAEALFFEIDGEEFFRTGPIVIENPGGEQVRGSFLKAFEEFYNVYFDQVYLRAIRFYDHFSKADEYERGFAAAVNGSNARSIGRRTALSWILNAPGDDYE
jgi:hypothetical protein